ncbi:hydrophobe/amphiphile efflux-1 (HAE1) family transporter [Xenococcus sp. PCC 7305]|uniref:efflux RND transporter permease subunit n=1 Tax=Xenococcus sp. PCC 7305 TaxID=102125 RepID=UPI0002AC4862|nr:efflux RND transporter permease subunit [Xenococcus sp. PCC 7305]ELS01894.1 hydrophobe/amphiphile efflux-1 (HAE1) family transporter [Xenococcus sp. PCC 7305]
MIFSIATPFIKRPVLTTVCTILIILVGLIAMALLPLDKLPEIAPKRVSVTANYVGADAQTTIDNVTTVLEREINGVEDAKWIDSFTDNNGNATINISFPVENDSNMAQVLVQNRVSQAQAELPQTVLATGLKTEKQSPSITLAYAFYAEKDENGEFPYDTIFINNYIDRYVWNDLRRIKGVGSITLYGSSTYAMRIWVDPDKLAARGLTASDVVNTIQEQNFDIGTGAIGKQPASSEQDFEFPLKVQGRFTTPEEAENMVVKVGDNGELIRIRDIGRAELGVQNYDTSSYVDDNLPAVTLLIYQLPGTNALDTAEAVKAKIAELEPSFPPGIKQAIILDNTLFVNASLKDLAITLIQAISLVVLVIFVFLQDWRTTIIPAIAIPVAMLGALIAAMALGFTLNNMSLFSLILATGLVVDDGIVVVEGVSTKLSQGMRPMQAALDSMEELSGAIVATSLVLIAVFVPVSFFPGSTGVVYKQFALIMAAAVAFSTFNALSFSPTMASILMKRQQDVKGPLGKFFDLFNRFFAWVTEQYRRLLELLTRFKLIIIAIFIAGLVATGWVYQSLPQGFIPDEDQGYFFAIIEAPAGVSLNYTSEVSQQVLPEIMEFEEVEHALALNGFSFEGQNSNKAIIFIKLHDWGERPGAKHSVYGVMNRLNGVLSKKIDGATVLAVNAPAVDGLSNFSGSELFIQDRQLKGMSALIDNTQRVLQAANQRPEIAVAFSTFTFDSPMLEADIDRDKAKAQNVDINEIMTTLQTYLGSNYVNQYVLDGRLYRVYAQAEKTSRANPQDISRLYVRSRDGALIQLSNFVAAQPISYPPIVTNYNVFSSIKINVAPAPGYSSGQVIAVMEEVAEQTLQPGFGYEWTTTAAEEKAAGGAAPIIFGLGFVVVFLVLAAQYESYIDPTIIMLTVPLAILGALGGIWLRSMWQGLPFNPGAGIWPILNNNIYCQVGLVMLIGMASKNAILIVEFANQARALGMSITKAAITAGEQRLRPILMTAFSSLFGFLPLVIADGAGALGRWSLGTAVFGGLAVSTVLCLLFVPNLYIVIKTLEQNFLKGGKKPKGGKRGGKGGSSRKPKEPPITSAPDDSPVPSFKTSTQNE